MHVHIIHFLR